MTSLRNRHVAFRLAHQGILEHVAAIQADCRVYKKVKARLKDLHDDLLSHWAQQNEVFFLVLRQRYQEDPQGRKMVEFLELDLKEKKILFLEFFERHSGVLDHIEARGFPLAFQYFAKEILARVQVEEEYLLPLLEDI